MERDEKAIQKIIRSLRQHEIKSIEDRALARVDKTESIEWSSSSEGILCANGRALAHELLEGYKLQEAQTVGIFDILFRRKKALQQLEDGKRIIYVYPTKPVRPFRFSSEKQKNYYDSYRKDALPGYGFVVDDSVSHHQEYKFRHAWYFRTLFHPGLNRNNMNFMSDETVLPSFWDLDIYRQTFETQSGQGGADHQYHLRMFENKLEFIAYEDGQSLDEYTVIGRNLIEDAQALVSKARENLQQHLSSMK
jgi:hypothetical protein